MSGRYDPFSLSFYGIGSSGGIVVLSAILAHLDLVKIMWLLIFVMSVAMIGFMGSRLVKLFIGEFTLRVYYPQDQIFQVLPPKWKQVHHGIPDFVKSKLRA